MSKVKNNDKDFLHDNNDNKADGKKKISGVKNTQVLNVEPDLFCLSYHTAKGSQSVKPEVP